MVYILALEIPIFFYNLLLVIHASVLKQNMKNLILTIALVFTSLLSFAQEGITITVTIDNVNNDKGKVLNLTSVIL